MPELPEAEVAARQLRARVMGSTVRNCWIGRPDIVREGLASLEWYRGTKIAGVERRGKSVILAFAGATQTRFLAAELGMTGLLLFQGAQTKHPQHTHCILQLDGADKPEIRYWNPRRFGRLSFLDQMGLDQSTSRRFGYDPLTITRGQFVQVLGSTRRRLKPLLMHQQVIAGIGNIYANDSCFEAKIDPRRKAKALTDKEIKALFESIIKVLENGMKYRGSSELNFVDVLGQKGEYQNHFLIYGRKNKPCLREDGGIVQKIYLGGRGTFFCENCQK